jgi:hypothetical protein
VGTRTRRVDELSTRHPPERAAPSHQHRRSARRAARRRILGQGGGPARAPARHRHAADESVARAGRSDPSVHLQQGTGGAAGGPGQAHGSAVTVVMATHGRTSRAAVARLLSSRAARRPDRPAHARGRVARGTRRPRPVPRRLSATGRPPPGSCRQRWIGSVPGNRAPALGSHHVTGARHHQRRSATADAMTGIGGRAPRDRGLLDVDMAIRRSTSPSSALRTPQPGSRPMASGGSSVLPPGAAGGC